MWLLALALAVAVAQGMVSRSATNSRTPTVTPSASDTPTASMIPPTPLPAPSYNVIVAPYLVCGNGECELTYEGYGESCGNCPVDCGPCQALEDVTGCVTNLTFALSYGGGPTAATVGLLNILNQYHINASFFVVASQLLRQRDVFQLEVDKGHSTFSQTFSDTPLPELSLEDTYWELINATNVIGMVTCRRPMLYRPPSGEMDESHRVVANAMGFRAVLWTLDSLDWYYAISDPNELLVEFWANLLSLWPASIILQQSDLLNAYVALTPSLISAAVSLNYRFVTMEECVWGAQYALNPTWVWSEAGCPDLGWVAAGLALRRGSLCPITEWSEWSECAACGLGHSTRIRLTYPLELQYYEPACANLSFIQLSECVANPLCPMYVWNDTYSDTDGSGRTVDSMNPYQLQLSVCGFGPWRWPNITATCSVPCGVGTAVKVRDWMGYGAYSYLCGPMTSTFLCKQRACPLPAPSPPANHTSGNHTATSSSHKLLSMSALINYVVGGVSGLVLILVVAGCWRSARRRREAAAYARKHAGTGGEYEDEGEVRYVTAAPRRYSSSGGRPRRRDEWGDENPRVPVSRGRQGRAVRFMVLDDRGGRQQYEEAYGDADEQPLPKGYEYVYEEEEEEEDGERGGGWYDGDGDGGAYDERPPQRVPQRRPLPPVPALYPTPAIYSDVPADYFDDSRVSGSWVVRKMVKPPEPEITAQMQLEGNTAFPRRVEVRDEDTELPWYGQEEEEGEGAGEGEEGTTETGSHTDAPSEDTQDVWYYDDYAGVALPAQPAPKRRRRWRRPKGRRPKAKDGTSAPPGPAPTQRRQLRDALLAQALAAAGGSLVQPKPVWEASLRADPPEPSVAAPQAGGVAADVGAPPVEGSARSQGKSSKPPDGKEDLATSDEG